MKDWFISRESVSVDRLSGSSVALIGQDVAHFHILWKGFHEVDHGAAFIQ
jgi:hypothetical protein